MGTRKFFGWLISFFSISTDADLYERGRAYARSVFRDNTPKDVTAILERDLETCWEYGPFESGIDYVVIRSGYVLHPNRD